MRKFTMQRHIYFADCDPAQIVFYPRYFEMFDRATEQMFRNVGLFWEELHKTEYGGMPLLEATASFKSPVRFGDTVEIVSWIDEIKGRTFVVRHDIYNGERHAVEGREVRVWAIEDAERPAGIRAIPMPEHVVAKFRE